MSTMSWLLLLRNGKTRLPCFTRFVSSPASTSDRPNDLEVLRRERERRERVNQVSDAMRTYLRSVQEGEEVLEDQKLEFEQGKRHLANIMGFDADTMTQKQIDASIKYLFPSGLFNMKSKPNMKPPGIGYPPRDVDVDEYGWPRHTLFYTLRPKFFSFLSDINRRTQRLIKEHDRRQLAYFRGQISEEEANQGHPLPTIPTKGWKYACPGEIINEDMRAAIAMALEFMAQLPNASLEADFLKGFGANVANKGADVEGRREKKITKPLIFKSSRVRVAIPDVKLHNFPRREATGISSVKATQVEATVITEGTGILAVDGHHYDVFQDIQAREILLSPMIVCGLLGKVDIMAKVAKGPGGQSVTPKAVRHATSLALAALYPELGERLRIAGLLDADLRKREREKINQPGARAKWIWKKR